MQRTFFYYSRVKICRTNVFIYLPFVCVCDKAYVLYTRTPHIFSYFLCEISIAQFPPKIFHKTFLLVNLSVRWEKRRESFLFIFLICPQGLCNIYMHFRITLCRVICFICKLFFFHFSTIFNIYICKFLARLLPIGLWLLYIHTSANIVMVR